MELPLEQEKPSGDQWNPETAQQAGVLTTRRLVRLQTLVLGLGATGFAHRYLHKFANTMPDGWPSRLRGWATRPKVL